VADSAAPPAGRTPDSGAPAGSSAAPPRWSLAWLTALTAGGVLLTVTLVYELHRRPSMTVAGLLVVGVAVAAVRGRRRLLALRARTLLNAAALLLPLFAIIGPALALPGHRQLFAFRLLLALVVFLGATVFITSRRLPRLGPRNLVVLFAAWFAWFGISLLWAPSPGRGLRYLAIIASGFVLMACVAAAGDSRRRLRILIGTLALGGGLAVAVGALEALTGRHLQSSGAAGGGHLHAATGFFYNANDLGTFIAIAWPFLLMALVFGRRARIKVLALLLIGLGLFSLLHTGSRSSLIAIGLTTLATAAYVIAKRWVRHTGIALVATVVVLLAFTAVALNSSQSTLLRQLQVQSLTQTTTADQTDTSTSSGTRLALTKAGFEAVARYDFLGVGPGNAESEGSKQQNAPVGITSLHDWWLEVFVNGGLPALVLYVLIYVGLLSVSFRAAARSDDRFVRLVAAATGISLIGYAVGSLGPSTVVSFTPMWILFGLAFAVARRAHAGALAPRPAQAALASDAR
jgi:teichuronic acid biosynthesis protein TuaE